MRGMDKIDAFHYLKVLIDSVFAGLCSI
uniref:Uncharacterized protein n=1 Tax=Arundo donax TaxID=35708 RepID=A0A0A9BKY1_ARUDO